MAIKPKGRSRERILVFGGYGVGKSRAILTVARNMPNSTFRIIDNDHAYERLLESEFAELTNVDHRIIYDRNDFDATTEQLKSALGKASPDDWVVIDMLDPTWDGVQEYWIDKIYGLEIDDYFLEVKQRKNAGKAAGDVDRSFVEMDWPGIKKIYTKRLMNQIVNAKCHVYCATAMKAIDRKNDSPDSIRDYGHLKGRPAGNKDIPYLFHTVLMFDKRGNDDWEFTTVKDRGRSQAEHESFDDFGIDYLVKIGGWENESAAKRVRRKSADLQEMPSDVGDAEPE